MRPESYRSYPRRCQNCKHVALLMKTSFLRKSSNDDTWCCQLLEKPPELPAGVMRVEYVQGYLSQRAQEEGKLPPDPPKMEPAAAEAAHAQWQAEYATWVTSNKINPEGSCNYHEFSNKGLRVDNVKLQPPTG